jgi:hypothetical protein
MHVLAAFSERTFSSQQEARQLAQITDLNEDSAVDQIGRGPSSDNLADTQGIKILNVDSLTQGRCPLESETEPLTRLMV